jgi:hypothetical protein
MKAGYGLNSEGLVAKLFMTRLTASALTQNPVPPQTFLVWLEQGGVLAALPLIACIVWITGFILFASLRTGRSSSLMRMTVCVSLYFGLLGLTGAGPAALSMETLWALILGVGFGAAYLSR